MVIVGKAFCARASPLHEIAAAARARRSLCPVLIGFPRFSEGLTRAQMSRQADTLCYNIRWFRLVNSPYGKRLTGLERVLSPLRKAAASGASLLRDNAHLAAANAGTIGLVRTGRWRRRLTQCRRSPLRRLQRMDDAAFRCVCGRRPSVFSATVVRTCKIHQQHARQGAQLIQAIVQRQKRMPAESDDDRLFLDR